MIVKMREPCTNCGETNGIMTTVNGQDTVRCGWCGKHCYNAPKSETGREPRTLRTRPQMKVSQRSRILLRDNGACIICHRRDIDLEVGHLISVKDGKAAGLTDAQLYSDENLAAMCAACNSGISGETIPLRFLAAVLEARLRNMDPPAASG